jgi:hypothetical protein
MENFFTQTLFKRHSRASENHEYSLMTRFPARVKVCPNGGFYMILRRKQKLSSVFIDGFLTHLNFVIRYILLSMFKYISTINDFIISVNPPKKTR